MSRLLQIFNNEDSKIFVSNLANYGQQLPQYDKYSRYKNGLNKSKLDLDGKTPKEYIENQPK